MVNFETLRSMLKGFANEPVEPDYSDSRFLPIRGTERRDGYTVQRFGTPDDYQVLMSPLGYPNPSGYMGLRIQKPGGELHCLTFRVAASNADATYQYKFNFIEGRPELEMAISRGVDVTGESALFRVVHCIPLVVLDLIDMTLPPQLADHRPQASAAGNWITQYKPCILCAATIPDSYYMCSGCRPVRGLATV
jgi:hypothetical protein